MLTQLQLLLLMTSSDDITSLTIITNTAKCFLFNCYFAITANITAMMLLMLMLLLLSIHSGLILATDSPLPSMVEVVAMVMALGFSGPTALG